MNVGEDKMYIKNKNPDELERQENTKKGKKNKNKNNTQSKKPPQQDEELTKEEETVSNYMASMFPNHKKITVINVMKRVGADVQKITEELLQIPQDNQTQNQIKGNSHQNYISPNGIELDCFQLMNNLTDEIQIDQFEFEELFEEVSDLIMNNVQINKILGDEMILECQDSKHQFAKIKAAYLDQLKIDDVDDQYLKEKYGGLLFEIQQFLLSDAKRAPQYKQKNVYNRYVEDFPSLGSQPGQSVLNKLHWDNVHDKIQKEKNFNKTSYFDQSNKKLPNWNQNNLHQLSGENYIQKKDIQTLAREYEMMNLPDLKIIYSHIGDIGTCRRFLNEYYSEEKSLQRQVLKPTIETKVVKSALRKKSIQASSRHQLDQKQINGELKNMSLKQLRDFVTHEMKLRAIFLQASAKTKNTNSKKKLINLANQNNNILMEYLTASNIKQLQEVYKTDANNLDLHGYYSIQAEQLVKQYLKQIPKQYKNCNSKLTTKTKQGKLIAEVTIITGKGLHSINHKSVLKTLIRKLLLDMKVDHDEIEGGFTVRLTLN